MITKAMKICSFHFHQCSQHIVKNNRLPQAIFRGKLPQSQNGDIIIYMYTSKLTTITIKQNDNKAVQLFLMNNKPKFIMAALCSRCGHYIFAPWFPSFFLFFLT